MLRGPTVRRMHRERSLRQDRAKRWRRQLDREHVPAAAVCETGPRLGAQGILSTSLLSMLGLDCGDVIIAGDEVLRMGMRPAKDADDWLEVNGACRSVEVVGGLRESLRTTLLIHGCEQAQDSVHPHGALLVRMDSMRENLSPTRVGKIGYFVRERLLPRLQKERVRSVDMDEDDNVDEDELCIDEDDLKAVLEAVRRVHSSHFVFCDNACYRLVPYYGPHRSGQVYLRWCGREYIGCQRAHRQQAHGQIREVLDEALMPFTQREVAHDCLGALVFRHGEYSLWHFPSGYFYLCRQIPAYVVEGADCKLYEFAPTEIGICIRDVESDAVVGTHSVQSMRPYRHMFLFDDGAGVVLCMPRSDDYFRRLWHLPLEEALLQHLESARMTLCAGYYEGSTFGYHSVEHLGLPVVSEQQAKRRGLPIFRFYRKRSAIR